MTDDVVCQRDLRVVMDDGAVLLADRWVARATRGRAQPTVLVRSPYGRRQLFGLIFGRLFAERGLQVLIQSVRGTFGSGGSFSPFDERADGLATLRWIRRQPWHAERIGMIGPSYLGLVQWAVAPEAGDDLAALSIHASASSSTVRRTPAAASRSRPRDPGSCSSPHSSAGSRRWRWPARCDGCRRCSPNCRSDTLIERATGAEVPWFREALANPGREDAYWIARDFAAGVGNVDAPVQLIGGWYDIFLPWMLEDFTRAAGGGTQRRSCVVGPWAHTAPGMLAAGMREGLAWLRSGLLGDDRLVRRATVRVLVTGERTGGGWRELPSWPPPGTGERELWLADDGRLQEAPPAGTTAGGDRYRYDPADPTPSLGGPILLAREPVVDNRPLEARDDVLTYTTTPLAVTLEAIGPVRVELWVGASSPNFDVFARVCDVNSTGASYNVCDALTRVSPGRFEPAADGTWRVAFDLWPIGHRFAAGHRIRLQVSSGAHPRFARNPGTGEDLATATATAARRIEVLHDDGAPVEVDPASRRGRAALVPCVVSSSSWRPTALCTSESAVCLRVEILRQWPALRDRDVAAQMLKATGADDRAR